MGEDIKNLLDSLYKEARDLPFEQVRQQVAGVCKQQPWPAAAPASRERPYSFRGGVS